MPHHGSILNFGAGPARLPDVVRQAIAEDVVDFAGTGIGLLEHGHRSAEFDSVIEAAESACRAAGRIGDDHAVLFLPGGATLQFAMVPLNLLPDEAVADHLHTGVWTGKAMTEAARVGRIHVAFDGEASSFRAVPTDGEIDRSPDAAYLHYCANNTVMGTQYRTPPTGERPLIVDASSEIFSRDPRADAHDLIYAGGQKNLGPSGITLVIVRRSLLDAPPIRDLPTMLDYRRHLAAGSRLNTPPTFGIQLMRRMFEWIVAEGGCDAMAERNERCAAPLYRAIDDSGGFYAGHATPESRSRMNVVFRTPSPELDARFTAAAGDAGMVGLTGHRSVGGLRASIYNACPEADCRTLAEFMTAFAATHG